MKYLYINGVAVAFHNEGTADEQADVININDWTWFESKPERKQEPDYSKQRQAGAVFLDAYCSITKNTMGSNIVHLNVGKVASVGIVANPDPDNLPTLCRGELDNIKLCIFNNLQQFVTNMVVFKGGLVYLRLNKKVVAVRPREKGMRVFYTEVGDAEFAKGWAYFPKKEQGVRYGE